MTDLNPAEWDTATYALMMEEAKVRHLLDRAIFKLHQMAGDEQVATGSFGRRVRSWQLSDIQAQAQVVTMAEAGDEENYRLRCRPSAVLNEVSDLEDQAERLDEQISEREDVWQQHRWTRWWPCLNADGHIHSTERGCKTVYQDTQMGWEPSLSGHTVEAAIAKLGPRLCSVCFPGAPAEHCRSLREITRAEREAAKAARAEAKFVKRLRDSEIFRDYSGSRVETVAGCVKALRDEVEFRDYFGNGRHPFHPASVAAAENAKRVLLAREAANPGTGATQAQIDQVIERAEIRNRKDGARI